MLDGMRESLEQQVARLLEEAERPMRVEEILPHLDPVMPSANDVAEILDGLTKREGLTRDGSFFARSTPVPIDRLFSSAASQRAAQTVVETMRELEQRTGEGPKLAAVIQSATKKGVPMDMVLDVLTVLRNAGEAYSVGGDRLRLAKP